MGRARKLVCALCGWSVAVESDVPDQCPQCHQRRWQSADSPKGKYDFTERDVKFLQSLRIAVETDP